MDLLQVVFEFVPNVVHDIHPLTVHFPIAFFTASFGLTVVARKWPVFNDMAWWLLVFGALAALAAVTTGLIAHEAYEGLPVMEKIEPHQWLGLVGTGVVVVLTIVRFVARRRGRDFGDRPIYLIVALIGLAWITLLGGTGGNLVYQHGLNVRSVNPLLEKNRP